MINKKIGASLFSLVFLFFSLSLISAELQITKETVSSVAVKDLNLPAIYNLHIKNIGDADTFRIYSLVGITMEPSESFFMDAGETKDIILKAYPTMSVKSTPEYYSFEYKISGDKAGLQTDDLAITITNLKDVFAISIEPLTIDSQKAYVTLSNKGGHVFEDVKLEMSSAFFSDKRTISVGALEVKKFEIPLDLEKLTKLLAGPYVVNIKLAYGNIDSIASTILKFEEKPGIKTTEVVEGILTRRTEIEKKNEGNVKTAVSVVITKDLFSSLFTGFNMEPSMVESSGFEKNYIFQKDISPSESLKVIAKTRWWILISIIAAILIIWYLADKYIKTKVVLSKKVSYVRTKGGEFALKVSIIVKARDFVEKLKIVDRLPPMVKVFDKFGAIAPNKIDERSRRLEWDLSALGKGESREFSYIIYSKVGMVGKFELPSAMALYEYLGQAKETNSNRAFFVNETQKKE